MKISIGTDHGGIDLREGLIKAMVSSGWEVNDHGAKTPESVDYPDYAALVGKDILEGNADFGVLICKSGIGMSISANKIPGIRAALVSFAEDAEVCRRHNNANIMVLSANHTSLEEAREWLKIFIETPFDGGRHQRRVDKLENLCRFCG